MQARTAIGAGYQYALVIFTLTALIGLANATKVFGDISQDTLLTHLHSGTLGWITMAALTTAAWLFGASSPQLGRNVALTAGATALYVLAFWSGSFVARVVFGTIELVVILAWWWWVVSRSMSEGFGRISMPKLSFLLAFTTLVIGSTIGVLIQLQFALGTAGPQTGSLIGTHASAQVGGYLVLLAAGLAEWRLGSGARSTAGTVQASLLFLAGLMLAMGILANVQPLLLLSNVAQLVGIVMVLARLGSAAIRAPWGSPSGLRHNAVALAWLALGQILLIVLTQRIIAAGGDDTKIPAGLFGALDHTMFIGLVTNSLLGVVLAFTADRPRVWPWADHVVFWGLNLGAASFVAVLLTAGTSAGARPFASPVAFTAPIMGLSVLLAIATLLMRLREGSVTQPAMTAATV